ncbi:MAG: RNA polymerase sigma factor [Elusimicrobia bacterium]|nr:RNA polymerase sigma factor [Elusimicrobiota bacterium]
MTQTTTDADLVRRVSAGEQDAYAALIERHHANVQGLCGSILGDPTSAEDAAQEVFLKAYKSLGNFQGDSSFGTWIYRIASNHCLDTVRSRSRRKTESLEALVEGDSAELASLFCGGRRDEAAQENADLAQRLLSRLPEDYRVTLILREVQGLSYEELAETMGCSLDAVKARLRRARSSLDAATRHFFEPGNV